MTLTIRTDYNTAAKILANVYKADSSATYSHKKRYVTGSAISAFIKYDNQGCYVDVQSNYYSLASLKRITEQIN